MSTETSKKLQTVFANDNNKVTISLNDPKDDLTAETVSTAMDAVVDAGTLLDKDGTPVDSAYSAKLITTTTETLF